MSYFKKIVTKWSQKIGKLGPNSKNKHHIFHLENILLDEGWTWDAINEFVLLLEAKSSGSEIEKRKKEDLEGAFEEEEEPYTPLPSNIPPLELDEEACYFPKTDSQSLGNLVSPILKEDEVEDSANAS